MKKTFVLLTIIALFAMQSQAQQDSAFKPSGNLWGYVFGDYYYKTHSDSLQRGGGNVQYRGIAQPSASNPNGQFDAFQVRRAYIGYDYNMAPNFSIYTVLAHEEGPSVANTGTDLDAAGNNTTYVKYLYLKWANIFKGSSLLIGQMPTPSFATPNGTEPLWGYRSVERTIMDMHNNDASSDLGVSLQGNLWKQQNSGDNKPVSIGYQVQVGNGTSAKPEADHFKKYRGTVFVNLMNQRLTVGVYGDENTISNGPLVSTTTMKGYAHYNAGFIRIGAEYFMQTNKNQDVYYATLADTTSHTKTTADGIQTGFSGWVTGKIIDKKLNFFVRADMYNPDTKYSSNNYKYLASATGGNMSTTTFYKQTFYTAGVDFTPDARIHIMPNIWYNKYDSMLSGILPAKVNSDYDMVYRVTFYFVFNGSAKVSNNGMGY